MPWVSIIFCDIFRNHLNLLSDSPDPVPFRCHIQRADSVAPCNRLFNTKKDLDHHQLKSPNHISKWREWCLLFGLPCFWPENLVEKLLYAIVVHVRRCLKHKMNSNGIWPIVCWSREDKGLRVSSNISVRLRPSLDRRALVSRCRHLLATDNWWMAH